LAYQAPEQLLGIPADGRADIFALGVILMELLVGRRVFHRPDPAGTIGAVLGGAVLPTPETVDPRVRPRVTQIFERALARDRDHRYPSGRIFHAELYDLASQLQVDLSPRSVALTRHLEVAATAPPDTVPSVEAHPSDVTEAPAVSFAPPETRPALGRIGWVAAIVALAGLLIGGLVFLGFQSVLPPEVETPIVDDPAPPPVDDAVSRAHRFAGMQALEAGDYTTAVAEFEAALAAPNPSSDLDRLLSIAQNLEARAEAVPEEPPPETEDTPAPPEVEEEALGLLLVTTDPPRLLIHIDGAVTDMSPARLELPPGRHRLAIWKGKKHRLIDRRIVIRKDGVVPINLDLTEQVAALTPSPRPKDPVERREANPRASTGAVASATTTDRTKDLRSGLTGTAPSPTLEAQAGAPSADEARTASEDSVGEAQGRAPTPTVAKPPAPPPSVPSATVKSTMNKSSGRFRRCYDRQLRRDETAEGTVALTMMVDPDGRVSSVSMRSTFSNSRMERCLRREVGRLQFPPHENDFPIPARFRLVFEPTS
ncbi:MAG: AgmX/PglI C-terminal domain-containing protein, partial [Myxococcota bacterium]